MCARTRHLSDTLINEVILYHTARPKQEDHVKVRVCPFRLGEVIKERWTRKV